jgi:hypothetical protein
MLEEDEENEKRRRRCADNTFFWANSAINRHFEDFGLLLSHSLAPVSASLSPNGGI